MNAGRVLACVTLQAIKKMDPKIRMAPPIEGEDEADPQTYKPKSKSMRY